MQTAYPDYYEEFICIADKCNHSCCIGWEIDIDDESLEFYKSVQGDFGKRLRNNISEEGTAHFILGENERCPFLNSHNLCDIYTNLGKEHLCGICSEHPRFYNQLSTHTEAGLGLCCEEAARLIITKKEPVKLVNLPKETDFPVIYREEVFSILQNRAETLDQHIEALARFLSHSYINTDISPILSHNISHFLPLFEGLERMDENWSILLNLTHKDYPQEVFPNFDYHIDINGRETEYEQFLCYLVYRHMAKAEFAEDVALYSAFAILCYRFVRFLGALVFSETGDFTTENQLELMRLFSSEIEYSDENPDIILDFIEKEIFGS